MSWSLREIGIDTIICMQLCGLKRNKSSKVDFWTQVDLKELTLTVEMDKYETIMGIRIWFEVCFTVDCSSRTLLRQLAWAQQVI